MVKWWQNQVKILPTETTQLDSEQNQNLSQQEVKLSGFALVLPRQCYFETYKTYPLSVGKDIYKITKVDSRQVSPYSIQEAENLWHSSLIIKNEDHYLVYYFVLLPKYQPLLSQKLPLLVVPETANALSRLNKAKLLSSEDKIGFNLDKNSVWLSDVSYTSTKPVVIGLEQLNLPFVQAFFNPLVFTQLATKFTRMQQLKWVLGSFVLVSIYLGAVSLYFTGVDAYLSEKRAAAGPIISEVFKVRSELQELQAQQNEIADVFAQSVEKTGPLLLLEQNFKAFDLKVKSIDLRGKTVRVQATANDANALLERLLGSEFVTEAGFQSEVKKINQDTEQFELELTWEQPLWQ